MFFSHLFYVTGCIKPLTIHIDVNLYTSGDLQSAEEEVRSKRAPSHDKPRIKRRRADHKRHATHGHLSGIYDDCVPFKY